MSRTFYDVLGVAPGASPDDIKRAYRSKARELHPDRFTMAPPAMRARSESEMRDLNEANDVLSDPTRRLLYDRCLASGQDFYQALALHRPESDAERRAREASEADQKKALAEAAQLIERAVAALNPTHRWTREAETYQYFDLVLGLQRGPRRTWLHVKIVPTLGPADLPGIRQHAERLLSRPLQGLLIDQYAYLLMGVRVQDESELRRQVVDLNTRLWNQVSGRRAKAMIAYGNMETGLPVVPGAVAPDPDLGRLRVLSGSVGPTSAVSDSPPPPPPATGGTSPGSRPAAAAGAAPWPSKGAPASASARGKALQVLVVDDDPVAHAFVVEALTPGPWVVHKARDWSSFQKFVMLDNLAVVLLDLGLPVISGEKIAHFVQTHPELEPRPRVVLFSAKAEPELRKIASDMGVFGYVPKSGDPKPLRSAIEAAAKAWEAAAASRTATG